MLAFRGTFLFLHLLSIASALAFLSASVRGLGWVTASSALLAGALLLVHEPRTPLRVAHAITSIASAIVVALFLILTSAASGFGLFLFIAVLGPLLPLVAPLLLAYPILGLVVLSSWEASKNPETTFVAMPRPPAEESEFEFVRDRPPR